MKRVSVELMPLWDTSRICLFWGSDEAHCCVMSRVMRLTFTGSVWRHCGLSPPVVLSNQACDDSNTLTSHLSRLCPLICYTLIISLARSSILSSSYCACALTSTFSKTQRRTRGSTTSTPIYTESNVLFEELDTGALLSVRPSATASSKRNHHTNKHADSGLMPRPFT